MRLRFVGAVAATLIASTACGGDSGGSARTALAGASSPPLSLSSDASAKTVSFTLVASFDGGSVTVTCSNKGPLNHSCAVVADEGASQPLFTGAATPNPGAGLPAGQHATFTFKPNQTGTFRIVCLVPGHEPEGMWIALKVTESGPPAAYSVTS